MITGGSQGMGRGVARLLAQKGANVVLVARGLDKLEATIEYIRVSITFLCCVSDLEADVVYEGRSSTAQ